MEQKEKEERDAQERVRRIPRAAAELETGLRAVGHAKLVPQPQPPMLVMGACIDQPDQQQLDTLWEALRILKELKY